MSNAALQEEAAPIVACTISRDVQNFDLLIEDMENECGENWGDLSLDDASAFFDQPEADALEFVALAMDQEDEAEIDRIADLVRRAHSQKIKVLVIAEDVSPVALHQLLRLGAQEFVPYPLPDGALRDAIERMRAAPDPAEARAAPTAAAGGGGDRDDPVHSSRATEWCGDPRAGDRGGGT